jgi:hypothetical protein
MPLMSPKFYIESMLRSVRSNFVFILKCLFRSCCKRVNGKFDYKLDIVY